MGLCTSPKNLVFLGSEVPLLLYTIEMLLILMIISLFVAAGEFLACLNTDNCQIDLRMKFILMDYVIDIPVGYEGDGLELFHLIVLAVYTVLLIIMQIRLRARTEEMESMFKSNADLSVMLTNVSKIATKAEIRDLFTRLDYKVELNDIFLTKNLRRWH